MQSLLLQENKDLPSLDCYRKYIEFEKKSNDPARIQNIYERAVADNCLNAELWNDYITYLVTTHLIKHSIFIVRFCVRQHWQSLS